MKTVLSFGKNGEKVVADLQITGELQTSYIAEAIYEDSGEYLSETEILKLESSYKDLIRELCNDYSENEYYDMRSQKLSYKEDQ